MANLTTYLNKPEVSNAELPKLYTFLEFSLELSIGDFASMEESFEEKEQMRESLKNTSF